jgi:streptogramin lyase
MAVGICLLGNSAQQVSAAGASRDEVLFTDSDSAVIRAPLAGGLSALVAKGHMLVDPFGICVGNKGELFTTDTGCLGVIAIDPATGAERSVASGGLLGVPFGIAAEKDGHILVANAQVLLRIDPQTGSQTVLTSGGYLPVPLAVAVGAHGDIYVADALGAVVKVDPQTGIQSLLTKGGLLERPQGIAIKGNDIYVTDVATKDGNFGIGRIVHVDAGTGDQSVTAVGENLIGPVGIALESNGSLIVADPYTINPASPTLYDGGIIRIDPSTGAQELLARGAQGFGNPRCVAMLHHTIVTQ